MDKSTAILLDVREQDEWDAGHIEEAQHIALSILGLVAEERIPNKKTQIILCCRSGGRASMAFDMLKKLGYENLAILDGGYQAYCGTIAHK